MTSKISKTEWGLVIGATAAIDLLQLILDVFLIGIVANRIIDILVGMTLPFYFKLRGVKMSKKKTGSIIITFLIEFLGIGIDALPFWTADVVVIMILDNAEKKAEEVARNKVVTPPIPPRRFE